MPRVAVMQSVQAANSSALLKGSTLPEGRAGQPAGCRELPAASGPHGRRQRLGPRATELGLAQAGLLTRLPPAAGAASWLLTPLWSLSYLLCEGLIVHCGEEGRAASCPGKGAGALWEPPVAKE